MYYHYIKEVIQAFGGVTRVKQIELEQKSRVTLSPPKTMWWTCQKCSTSFTDNILEYFDQMRTHLEYKKNQRGIGSYKANLNCLKDLLQAWLRDTQVTVYTISLNVLINCLHNNMSNINYWQKIRDQKYALVSIGTKFVFDSLLTQSTVFSFIQKAKLDQLLDYKINNVKIRSRGDFLLFLPTQQHQTTILIVLSMTKVQSTTIWQSS